MQLKHMHKVSADASFCVVALGSLSTDEQVSQLLLELESGLRALGRMRSLREIRVRFKINEMLFDCLNNLKKFMK